MAGELTLTIGPFIGVNDTPSLAAQDAQRAAALRNMYGPAAVVGGDLISRPGVTRVSFAGGTLTNAGTLSFSDGGGAGPYAVQLISSNIAMTVRSAGGSNVTVSGTGTLFTTELSLGDLVTNAGVITRAGVTGPIYAVMQYVNTNGTVRRYVLAKTSATAYDGTAAGLYRFLSASSDRIKLVEYDPTATTRIWVDRTSASMNGVALDITTRIYATTFANYLILSDGTNRPRKIDSSFVLSNLTDANYAFLGPLTQYYGKLFGIDASDAVTIRWSEENDPDTGYGTGTSDNSWALRQTSADALTGLIGTNDALYCFRQNSTAIITGAANSDFRSSGTVDAIQNIGSKSPDSLLIINSSVCFLDQYGRPGRIQPGYGYIPLWKRIQGTLRGVGVSAAQLRAGWGRYDPTTNLVKFAYRASAGATTNAQMLVFDADTWESFGTHQWYADTSYTAMDHAYSTIWTDANGNPRHVIASGTTSDVAVYIQQTESVPSASAQDATAGGNATVAVSVTSPKLGVDTLVEKEFTRLTVGTRNVGGTTDGVTKWKSSYVGPYLTAYSTPAAMTIGGSTTVPATCTVDGAAYKAEQRGISVRGRWMQAVFTNDTTGAARSTFDQLTVRAVPADDDYTRR